MALSAADPYYRAETVPPSINALGRRLCAGFSRPPAAFGAKGNLVHYSGYHRSRRWILSSRDSRHGASDYSVRQQLDQGGDDNWVCAFDFTPGEWGSKRNRELMAVITRRVYEAAKRRDPRLAALREFAGTLDGRTVATFNCADGSTKSPFDASHLDHVHGSFWRSRSAQDHTGIAEIIMGEDDDMAFDDEARRWLEICVQTLAAQVVDSDTITGIRWHGQPPQNYPNHLRNRLNALATAAVASAQREQDMLTAIAALAQGGGSVDVGVILTRIDARTADVTGVLADQAAEIDRLQQLVAELRAAQAAAARAEAEALDGTG